MRHRKDFSLGYASGFRGLNDHVNALVPSPEDIDAAIRKENPLLPRIAIRELLANALIHQDMTMTGTGPTVELFRNRMEVVNPGAPLVEPARLIDSPLRSRNEALASLMRRMGLCEEQGTGIDKTIEAVEQAQLPPPEFRAEAGATRATLFGPRRFADMTTEERLRACYQHAVLRYLSGNRMKNSTLRERFGNAEVFFTLGGVLHPACCSGRILDYTSLLNWLIESEDMIKVGAFEAKTHLSSLLDKVAQGEDVLITRRGLPVARLVPAGQAERARTQSVIAELRALRASINLDGLDWRELRDEGRR